MEQLRFTTCAPQTFGGSDPKSMRCSVSVEDMSCTGEPSQLKGTRSYIHGKAEEDAGYDIPMFFAGSLLQLDAPIEEQDIVMVLDDKEFPMVSKLQETSPDMGAYYIIYKSESEAESDSKLETLLKESGTKLMSKDDFKKVIDDSICGK